MADISVISVTVLLRFYFQISIPIANCILRENLDLNVLRGGYHILCHSILEIFDPPPPFVYQFY